MLTTDISTIDCTTGLIRQGIVTNVKTMEKAGVQQLLRSQWCCCSSPGSLADSDRRSLPTALPPIVEEYQITEEKEEDGDCCRCCRRRDREARSAFRDLDLHGIRSVLGTGDRDRKKSTGVSPRR